MNVVCRVALAAMRARRCDASRRRTPGSSRPASSRSRPSPISSRPRSPREQPQKYEETVVVSGSQTEEKLINAPATMTVITADSDRERADANFAELLRSVPGLNITQVSARDINVTTRGATGTLATGQLALLDGRSLYQDFFGFVMWDFLPVNLNEIKQIEVIRGPASAVWGANALNGVVNVITQVAARDAGHERDRRRRQVRSLGRRQRRRTAARSSTSAARTRRRSTIAGRSSSRAAATRRMRCRGRPASIPGSPRRARPIRPSPTPARRSRSSTGASTTTSRTAGSCRSPAASPAPTASCTPASGPFDINQGSVMGYGKVNFSRQGPARQLLHQHPRRRRGEPADARRQLPADRLRLPDQDLRLRASTTSARSGSGTSSATAATCASTTSTCRSRRGRQPHRGRRLRPGRDLPVRPLPLVVGGARRSLRLPRRLRVLAAHDLHGQAERATTRSACPTTAPTARRR